ncbi:hypothetical protein [Paracraurococcus ruber]|uniref:hypothetical protein n=1 Tax=Paracraurococcus ruber TaxID=77675 RepID=UPI001057D3AC|nr:hypothetical protein [Paracraurococcus ruber]TDG16184.1 hypothetical protein E2C05_29590 [Paracraurococcus ruber]
MSEHAPFRGQPYRQVEIRSLRDCRVEILDDGGDGWMVVVHTPDPRDQLVMRNSVPHGLAALLAEAEAYVNRRANTGRLPDYP